MPGCLPSRLHARPPARTVRKTSGHRRSMRVLRYPMADRRECRCWSKHEIASRKYRHSVPVVPEGPVSDAFADQQPLPAERRQRPICRITQQISSDSFAAETRHSERRRYRVYVAPGQPQGLPIPFPQTNANPALLARPSCAARTCLPCYSRLRARYTACYPSENGSSHRRSCRSKWRGSCRRA